jgi:4-alpha-glucanotransferase
MILDELSRRYGIETEYLDARGEQKRVPWTTQRKVLEALGCATDSRAAIPSALDKEERELWIRALPPVVVVRGQSGSPSVDVIVPETLSATNWRLQLEGGRQLGSRASFESLQLIDALEVDGIRMQRRRLLLPADLPLGYHDLKLDCTPATCRLIVCPETCWMPELHEGEPRLWGVAVQQYLIRSPRNWGIGDFTDLRELMRHAVQRGLDIVGVNPLHALYPDRPEQASPYSPSTRLLLNVLYIDVTAIDGYGDLPEIRSTVEAREFQENLAHCRSADLVQYERIANLKMPVLRLLFAHAAGNRNSSAWREFEAFRARESDRLERSCVFQALREHFGRRDSSGTDWREWPQEFQNPASTTVAAFAESSAGEISFFAWLQWQADIQLKAARDAGGGLRVGLYRDLAVGTDPAGAECWSNQALMISSVHVGAPPDLFQPKGQDWGLAPFHPRKLRDEKYATFIDLLRANMRHAGALRIDHVMALERLYWIPHGCPPTAGAYVHYPLEDLLGIVTLESQRNRCLVIGEDLGTVKPEFREKMNSAGILSYRVLSFERDSGGGFLPAARYPKLALAVAGNHDLPTIRGWWEGRDIELKSRLHGSGDPDALRDELAQRESDRAKLLAALVAEGLLAASENVTVERLVSAVHGFLKRTPCVLAMAQLDDLAEEADPVNVPASSSEHPNWRRRLSVELDALMDSSKPDLHPTAIRQSR